MKHALRDIDPTQYDILIVDDNPENLKVLGNFLVEQGFNVRAARDGKQALDSVEAEPPELVLLDIHMPVLDGYEVCRRLKESEAFSDIPIIFLSALGETFNKVLAFELGAADYISKPFELEEVRVRVNTQLMAHRLLAENRAGFRASFEQAATGILHAHLDGCVFAANRRFCEMLGIPNERLIGRNAPDLLGSELGAALAEDLAQLRDGAAESPARNVRWSRPEGENCWLRTRSSRIVISANRDPYAAVFVEDVSDQRRADEDRARLAAALEQAPDAIAIADADGAIVYVNHAWEQAHGAARDELRGQRLPLFSEDPEHAPVREALAQEGTWHGRTARQLPAGARITEEHHVSVVRGSQGEIESYIAVSRDISLQLRLEDQLRQSQKMEAIGTLAAGIAHDFNNLLAAISGFTELALEDLPPGTEVSANLREVAGASERARELVRQILAFGRQSEFKIRTIHLNDAIEDVIRLLRRTIPPTVEIRSDLDESCPPVLADATAIHQILMNLCTNAYHAMEEAGGVLGIRLSHAWIDHDQLQGHPELEAGRYARIDVSDTGHGMEEHVRQRIFEPYFTTKHQVGGTGLGLATVHGIVSDLSGAIHVYSEAGLGSTFSIVLPIAPAGAEGAESAADDTARGGNEHVMFVDDEASICRFAEKALQRLGYRATTVSNPARALELLRAAPQGYDVIITDEMMPQMRGSELLAAVREINAEIPVILYSGFSGAQHRRPNTDELFNAHVMKPMVTSELSKAIRTVLDGRAQAS
ncbi:MAG: response regulator [Candidatus Hydrogenedentes bacterium]|nr:response regulator [Candidatus Hydrogenedentota bacterium]